MVLAKASLTGWLEAEVERRAGGSGEFTGEETDTMGQLDGAAGS